MAPSANSPAPPAEDDTSSTIARTNSSASSILSNSSSKQRRGHSPRSAAILRTISFFSSVVAALCAGSITVFSLYGHIFQERLHYTQLQVNGLSIGSSIALYLPVSALGYLCDRAGARPLAFLAAVLFGGGYGIAAATYRKLDIETANGLRGKEGRLIIIGDDGLEVASGRADWTYPLMVFAFICVGVGTCSLYLAAVATNAKNFGKGRHRGLALAVPIAAFGLSGLWLSQVGSHVFYERHPDGVKGDLDVFRFFIFLAVLLVVVGVIGGFTLNVVDEDDIIEEAVEELERSGLLNRNILIESRRNGYGGTDSSRDEEGAAGNATGLEASIHDEAWRKKEWVLNAETQRFLMDRTMWCLALGFLLIIGPGEAFINNLGTVIGTLYSPTRDYVTAPTSPSTHVSIVAITSTAARLLTGSLTDLLAPSPSTQHFQVEQTARAPFVRRLSISRVAFLLFFAIVLSIGLLALASGAIQGHGERFWFVSSFVGAGYGAVFSLTPIIITVIWGVENFATNWGIVAMFPALGSTFWGLVYSGVYQAGAKSSRNLGQGEGDVFCYGQQCYATTFWAMTVTVWAACFLVLFAWKGPGGWSHRGIVI